MNSLHPSRLNNFDLIRLLAAAQVVFVHAVGHTPVLGVGPPWLRELLDVVILFPGVAVFFVVSGFLIAKSYERLRDEPRVYLWHRVLRIYPALFLCFAVAMIALGVFGFLTPDVVGSVKFWGWLAGQLSFGQFYNPEFFRGFGMGVVNGALWTISVELQFYLFLPLFYAVVFPRVRRGVMGSWLLAASFVISFAAFWYVDAATNAAAALQNLSNSPNCCQAILAALTDTATPLDAFPSLQQKLRSSATARLLRTEAGEDAAALEAALAMATAMGTTDEAVTARVHLRLVELRTAATRRARRESVGLNVALPADFTCPITYDKMKDPVVASDGHSYERSAIEEILRGPHPISPLTRATLGTALVPNLNLRRRIEEHEAELDRMAEQMAARMAGVAAEAEEKAAAAMAAAKAEAEAAKAEAKAEAEAEMAAAKAEAEAEIEALRQQLKANKRGRAGVEGEDEDDEEGQRAPKRRASSRRSS